MHNHHIPVIKDGTDVGLAGLERGDILFINSVHLIPLEGNLSELVSNRIIFVFEELRFQETFLWGRGIDFDSEEFMAIRRSALKNIRVVTLEEVLKIIIFLANRNKSLTQENDNLRTKNTQLMLSHFNGPRIERTF